MVVSMTGFGRSEIEKEQFSVTVEIKTVNNRFRDYYFKMPRQLIKIEDKIKKVVNEYVSRGRIEVFVTITGEGFLKRKVQIDWDLLKEYERTLYEITSTLNLKDEISLHHIVNREEFLQVEEREVENESLNEIILRAAEEASLQLKEMRIREGLLMYESIMSFTNELSRHYKNLVDYAPTVITIYEERLKKKLEDTDVIELEEGRLLPEILLYADKSDISEELTRFNSHMRQLLDTIELNNPIGRKLDFILQEMNREINTIGSKANDVFISKEVVEMKSLLEKIKEQVQNIE